MREICNKLIFLKSRMQNVITALADIEIPTFCVTTGKMKCQVFSVASLLFIKLLAMLALCRI